MSSREPVPAITLWTIGGLCFVAGITQLGEGSIVPGAGPILLIAAWVLVTIGFILSPSILTIWRWGSALILGCALFFAYYYLQPNRGAAAGLGAPRPSAEDAVTAESRTDTPEPSAVTQTPSSGAVKPATPTEVPLVGAGATVSQETSGDNSPNIIAGGDVTVDTAVDPNTPVVFYDPDGTRHAQIGGRHSADGGRRTVYQTIQSLYDASNWGEVVKVCEEEIKATPDWLTPYLYAGVAYANLGDSGNARRRLAQFSKRASANPDYADWHRECIQILGELDETQTDHVSSVDPSGTVTPGPAGPPIPKGAE